MAVHIVTIGHPKLNLLLVGPAQKTGTHSPWHQTRHISAEPLYVAEIARGKHTRPLGSLTATAPCTTSPQTWPTCKQLICLSLLSQHMAFPWNTRGQVSLLSKRKRTILTRRRNPWRCTQTFPGRPLLSKCHILSQVRTHNLSLGEGDWPRGYIN